MKNLQDVFDKVVNHMRAQGNPWGPYKLFEGGRPWGMVNPDNPCQRCAKGILEDVSLIGGKYIANLDSLCKIFETVEHSRDLVQNLEYLFEYGEYGFNTHFEIENFINDWEGGFKFLAKQYNLEYKAPAAISIQEKELNNG